jgi:UDP-glucose 4-epimerase
VRVLITGGAGFVGTALAEALAARGDRVAAVDVVRTPRLEALLDRGQDVAFLQGEVTEWPQVADALRRFRPNAVVHCAAIVGVPGSLASPIATFRVNVEGGLNVLEAMRLQGVPRMINISTEEVYGHFGPEPVDEEHPCRPIAPYGISKLAFEQLTRSRPAHHGVEVIHVRTSWVYGPGLPRPRVPKTLVDAVATGTPLHLDSGGDFRADHVHIDDLVAGLLLVLDKRDHRFDLYHVATGEAPSLAEMVAALRRLAPGAELSIGPGHYTFADGTPAVRKGPLAIARARAELGYRPRYPYAAGLESYLARRRAHPS